MSKVITFNTSYETTINKGIFLKQDIEVRPDTKYEIPYNLSNVIKFLFGEGSYIVHSISNGYPEFIIKNANFVLNKVKTKTMDWTIKNLSNNSESEE